MAAQEGKIMATADDAILAKLATVQAGYYQDPFLESFGRHAIGLGGNGSGTRRRQVQPIIKRGTHARVCCMDRVLEAFLESPNDKKQVVILGCGKDTAFFRHTTCNKFSNIQWIEVDHASVIQTKATIIQDSPTVFHSKVEKTTLGFSISTNNHPCTCHLIEHDLRLPTEELIQKLKQSTPDFSLQTPTL